MFEIDTLEIQIQDSLLCESSVKVNLLKYKDINELRVMIEDNTYV